MKRTIKQQAGLTLIELMITIAIIAILSGLAIPAYDRYTTKSVRAAAKTELEKVRSLMETYYVNNKSCTSDMTDLGYSNTPAYINKAGIEVTSTAGDSAYKIEVTNCAGGRDYSVQATPQNAQASNDTDCTKLFVTSLGVKGSLPGTGKCW